MSQRSVVARLAEEKGLVIVSPDALTLRRQRRGKGFAFMTESGAVLRDAAEIKRPGGCSTAIIPNGPKCARC
jgi:DNA topoisomerase-1